MPDRYNLHGPPRRRCPTALPLIDVINDDVINDMEFPEGDKLLH